MLYPKRKNQTDLKIEKIAKKLGIFSMDDIETLIDEPKVKILKSLEFLIEKNIIKKDDDCLIYIPQKLKAAKKKVKPKTEDDYLIEALTPVCKKPREIYIKKFNHLRGFLHFFLCDDFDRKKVIKTLKLLKDADKYHGEKLVEFLKSKKMFLGQYKKLKAGFSLYGFEYILSGRGLVEPIEVYNYFKEYYLSPNCLTEEQALYLAIYKFSNLIEIKLPKEIYSTPKQYLRRLKREYKQDEIDKFRTYNFSKFNIEELEEHIQKEN